MELAKFVSCASWVRGYFPRLHPLIHKHKHHENNLPSPPFPSPGLPAQVLDSQPARETQNEGRKKDACLHRYAPRKSQFHRYSARKTLQASWRIVCCIPARNFLCPVAIAVPTCRHLVYLNAQPVGSPSTDSKQKLLPKRHSCRP